MRYMVTFRLTSATASADADPIRDDIATQLERLAEARKVYAMGAFGDARGGYVDLEFERPEDLYAMLDGPLLDWATVEVHPVLPVHQLSETVRGLTGMHMY